MRNVLTLISIGCLLSLFSGVCLADESALTVRGEAEIKVPADRVSFDVSVVNEARTPEEALKRNSEKTEKIIAALLRTGLEEKEIGTGHFVIDPRWSQRPRQAPSDWAPEIVGYTVTNQLKIRTVKLELVGKLIAGAVKAGSNDVGGLNFDLENPRAYRQEVIRLAMSRARDDAKVLADAAGGSLGKIISLNLDHARAPQVRAMAPKAYLAEEAMTPPIVPGDVTVRASVTVVYALKQKTGW